MKNEKILKEIASAVKLLHGCEFGMYRFDGPEFQMSRDYFEECFTEYKVRPHGDGMKYMQLFVKFEGVDFHCLARTVIETNDDGWIKKRPETYEEYYK